MNRHLLCILFAAALAISAVWIGCATDENSPLAPAGDNTAIVGDNTAPASDNTSDKGIHQIANNGRAIEVVPLFRQRVDRGEKLTVFIFHAKPDSPPGKGKDKNGDEEEEGFPDTNTNQAFTELGFWWDEPGIAVEYHPLYEPRQVANAFDALDRSFTTWETAIGNEALVEFENTDGTSPPRRDDTNVIGWRRIVPRNVLAAAFMWDDGDITIVEVDIFFNVMHKWAVNPPIARGDTTFGEDFDVQAIATHEIGHLIGLGHVEDDGNPNNGDETDATMFPTAAKGELIKQTLTPGDVDGANAVAPSPIG